MAMGKREKERFGDAALAYADAVYRFAFYLCRDASDAEDLTQDTFLNALHKGHQFQPGTNLKAWLFRIARNAHIDKLRRKRREPEMFSMQDSAIEGRPPTEVPSSQLAGVQENPGADLTSNYLEMFGDEVTRFLEELPSEFRMALVLCDIDGLSYQEISEVLSCPVGTVRSRISRARSQLREKLFDYARELGYVRPQKECPPTQKQPVDDLSPSDPNS